MGSEIDLNQQLKTKQICRFCLSIDVEFTDIFSNENRMNGRAPLPLQIMSCVSIEVFKNDGMPSTICNFCRLIMDHCYRFKQVCKKADTALKQFPLTGIWPKKLELPNYPSELLVKNQKSPLPIHSPVKREHSQTSPSGIVISPSPKRMKKDTQQLQQIFIEDIQPIDPIAIKQENVPQKEKPKIMQYEFRPKILNKNNIKILNINAPGNDKEPIIKKPVVRTDADGNIEIVTEILENIEENDAIKNAPYVETDVFPCDMCERSFALRQLLDIHMTNHIRERSHICETCNKAFFSKYDLGKHELIHTGEKPYVCVVCKKAFSRSTLLTRHEKIHTDQPKLLCVHCEKPFLSKSDLAKHIERHNKRRPFPCKLCKKSFAFKQGLERHEVVHVRVQPHKCEHCEESFSTPSKLARHLTAHAGRRPYPCRLCSKSYLLSHHLTRHVRSHGRDDPGAYKCSECANVFATRDELIYHSAVHATQSLSCPLCKETFGDLEEVTAHIKSHTDGEQYACEFCDLIFTSEKQLETHRENYHIDEHAAYKHDNQTRIIKSEISDNVSDTEQIINDYMLDDHIEENQPETITGDPLADNDNDASKSANNSFEKFVKGFDDDVEEEEQQEEVDDNYDNDDAFKLKSNRNEIMIEDNYTDEPILIRTKNIKVFKGKVLSIPSSTNKDETIKLTQVSKSFFEKNDKFKNTLKKLPRSLCVTRKQSAAASTSSSSTITTSQQHTEKSPIKHSPPKKNSNKISPKQINVVSPQKPADKMVEIKIGSEMIRVQKVSMTKAEVDKMAKQGKIEYKGGQVFLKQSTDSKE